MTWRRLWALPAPERRLLVEAAGRLLAARAALWWLPPSAVARAGHAGARRDGAPDPAVEQRVAWAVQAVARRLPTVFRGCLPQALAACAMLRRRGIAARLVIGVRRAPAPGPIEAHAWVESGGRVILGGMDDLPSFVPLDGPPGAAYASAARHG
jgi:Transglutaminase-like superfamily